MVIETSNVSCNHPSEYTSDALKPLKSMLYSGRGIILGMTSSGNQFVGYSLTGRSPSSQARKLVKEESSEAIKTEVTDKQQLEKGSPALLLYPAIIPSINKNTISIIASNGVHTKLIQQKSQTLNSDNPEEIIKKAFEKPFLEHDQKNNCDIDLTTYEPDSPIFTPRISACLIGNKACMHIVWHDNGEKKQAFHNFTLEKGKAKLITTYKGGNEKPILLPFEGDPIDIEFSGATAEQIAGDIYSAISISNDFAVAAAVVLFDNSSKNTRTSIINKCDQAGGELE